MMAGKTNLSSADVAEMELCGVRLDERTQMVAFCVLVLRQGVSESETRAALEQFIQRKKLTPQTQWARFGIVNSAKDVIRDADREAAAARLVAEPGELQIVSLSDVTPEPIRWLWPGKIPLGSVTVIYGEAGLGKTCWALDLAARVSAGSAWPDGTSAPESGPAKVLLINSEDHLAESIQPRLATSGAVLQNIKATARIAVETSAGIIEERPFDLARDVSKLRTQIKSLGAVRLVVIDSLQACCGTMRQNGALMRAALAELGKLADECGVAIVLISAGPKCELPVKNVWRVDGDLLEPELRWWVPVRCNFARLPPGLAFRITSEGMAWKPGLEAPTADRTLGATRKQERSNHLRDIAEWLYAYLAMGSRTARDVLKAASAQGWSPWQVKRAKLALKITCYKEPQTRGKWIWELSSKTPLPVLPASANSASDTGARPGKPITDKVGGVVVVDRIYGSAISNMEDPLAWLDRVCPGNRTNPPPSETTKGSKGSKENKENKENGGTPSAAAPGR